MNTIATIQDADYGLRDFPDGRPGLSLDVQWDEGRHGALICFQGDEAERFFVENHIYSVASLNGRQCLISVEGDNTVRFLSLA